MTTVAPPPITDEDQPAVSTASRRPSRWLAIAALASAELRRLVRDRVALLFIIVMPVVVIVIVGATIGGAARHVPVGVVDEDGSPASQQLVQLLRSSGKTDVTTYTSTDDLVRDIRMSAQVAGLTIPKGFGEAASSGAPASVVISAVQQQDAQTVQPVVQSAVDTIGTKAAAAAFVTRMDGVDQGTATSIVERTAGELAVVPVQTRTVGTPMLESDNQFSYTAPSNLVLFMFITSVAGGAALVETRRQGIPRRMLAAPVGTATIIAGFGGVRLIIALVQASLIIAVGSIVFDVSWGQPAGVAALVFVYALMAVGAGLAVGAVARNAEQATAIGIPVGIALGMLGGCMWPLDVVPEGLRAAGHLTPQAWAMDGFIGLVFNGKGLADIAGDVAVLAAYALALLTLGVLLLRRTLNRGT